MNGTSTLYDSINYKKKIEIILNFISIKKTFVQNFILLPYTKTATSKEPLKKNIKMCKVFYLLPNQISIIFSYFLPFLLREVILFLICLSNRLTIQRAGIDGSPLS